MPVRAVLFDLGDTLLHWTCDAAALRAAAGARGVQVDAKEAGRWWAHLHARPVTPAELGMGEGWTANRYAAALLGYYAEADSLAPGLSGWLVERAVDPACYAAFPGAAELVSGACRLGLRVGVVSDTGFDVRPALERCGLAGSIEAVVLSHEQGASKPAERLFRHACPLLDVPPAQTVLVGDNPAADGGAVAAGLTVLLLPALAVASGRDLGAVFDLLRGLHRG